MHSSAWVQYTVHMPHHQIPPAQETQTLLRLIFTLSPHSMGIPDSHIILMLPDDTACNPRNPLPGAVYAHIAHDLDLYGDTVQVDYRGYDVTVTNFVRLLTGVLGGCDCGWVRMVPTWCARDHHDVIYSCMYAAACTCSSHTLVSLVLTCMCFL